MPSASRNNQELIRKDVVKPAAQSNWRHILVSHGIEAALLTGRHGPCPICGGRDRFRFDDREGNGTFFCSQCGSGDGFKLLMLHMGWTSFRDALNAVAGVLGLSGGNYAALPAPARTLAPKADPVPDIVAYEAICKLWDSGEQIQATDPAGKYILEERLIPLAEFPPALRIKTYSAAGPELIAAFTSPEDKLVQVHRILLTDDGQKRQVEGPKRFMPRWLEGAINGGAVKLFEPTDELGITEGIETGLAAHCMTGLPIWSSCTAGALVKVKVPERVKTVTIFADNDESGTGQKAAIELAKRLDREGKTITIRTPNRTGEDHADYFKNRGAAND